MFLWAKLPLATVPLAGKEDLESQGGNVVSFIYQPAGTGASIGTGKSHQDNTEDIYRAAVNKVTSETRSSSVSQMEMESAKLRELLAATFMFLTLLIDPIAACTCVPLEPAKAYCSSAYFLKAQVLDTNFVRDNFERLYKIKVTKVLKGPVMQKKFHNLYTAAKYSLCGYEHPTPFNRDEYLFGVRRYGDRLSTSLCDLNKKWDSLSDEDKKGFEGGFQKTCN